MTGHGAGTSFARKIFAAVILSFLMAGQTALAGIALTQANGEALILPAPAKRIITLAPNLAELVFAAGAGERLIAVVEYSDFPPAVKQITKVGDAFRIDLERIINLKPDLVIAWTSGNPQTALQKLEQLGITVWQIEITRPNEIAATVDAIALAAGTGAQGIPVAEALRKQLSTLVQENSGKPPLDFFYQIAANPLYTVNGQHIISRSMEICGARNIFAELPSLAPQVSQEAVILANPQAMIAPEIVGDTPALAHWNDWPRLKAVQTGALLYLPADDISRAAPRLLDSIELACKLLDEVRKSGH